MAIWEDLKKYGNVAAEKAEEFGKIAASKTEELTKIGKIKLEILQLEKDLQDCFSDLGSYVFNSTEKENVSNFSGSDKFFKLIGNVKDLKNDIIDKENLIKNIQEETNKEN